MLRLRLRVEDERAAFRRDLREAIKLSRREAASQIEDLCNRYGRNYSDDLRSKAKYLLSRSAARCRVRIKFACFALAGVPEPGILDFLANEIHHMINSAQRSQRLERGSHRCGQAITEH